MKRKKRRGLRDFHQVKQTKLTASTEIGSALRKASKFREQVQLELAEACCRSILDRAPDYFDAHLMLGDLLAELGRHAEAIATYDRALQINLDNSEALYNRGNSLLHLRRNEEAVASYDRAVASK